MKKFGNQHFNQLIERKIKNFFKSFNKEAENDSSPLALAKEKRDKIETEITATHESNSELNSEFFEVDNTKGRKKNLTYASVIEDYCQKSGKSQQELFEFTASIVALYKIRTQLNEIITEASEALRGNIKNNQTNFTTARKVIIFSILMNDFFEKNYKPDKTVIAKFINSLISDKPLKGDIKNSNLYDRVKTLFFNLPKAKVNDLLFVKARFEELDMASLVERIESIIKEKKQKKQ